MPATTKWRSSGKKLAPPDLKLCFKRLTALQRLTWPTADEQVEQRVLISWLNPDGAEDITDQQVLVTACRVLKISVAANDEALMPAYVASDNAWHNLATLVAGRLPRLDQLEPELDHGGRRRTGHADALDWWETVMRTLQWLIDENYVGQHELPAAITCYDLNYAIYRHFTREYFDSPLAIGAGLYLHPSIPSVGLGHKGQMFNVVAALTQATAIAISKANEALEADLVAELTRVDFFWQQLKGLAFVLGQNVYGPLHTQLASDETLLDEMIKVLRAGLELFKDAEASGFAPLGFSCQGDLSKSIANAPTDQVIAKMTDRVNDAKQELDAQR